MSRTPPIHFPRPQTIIHPLYNEALLMNDIALVKLAVRLNLPIAQNLIAPICLPTVDDYVGTRVEAIGWGDIQVSWLVVPA